MDRYVTGSIIKQLRERRSMTQQELAKSLYVSDKTVSKWENGKGYPDISLLEPIAEVFGISVSELLSGRAVSNANVSGNMLRSKFYVCPVCGNVLHSMGEAVISCHGITLLPAPMELIDEKHGICIKHVEDEYYVRIEHEMTKQHYISFIAAIYDNGMHMLKLYPEGSAEGRFKAGRAKRILFYCNRDGLYYTAVQPV